MTVNIRKRVFWAGDRAQGYSGYLACPSLYKTVSSTEENVMYEKMEIIKYLHEISQKTFQD